MGNRLSRSMLVLFAVCPLLAPLAAVAQPAIALVKTVGTVPGVCAATDVITVPGGTTVHYCFQAQNTGNVALNFHSLVDSDLGTVVTNLPYALAPGAFSPEVIVPKTMTATTTNTGTWTAASSLGYSVNTSAAYSYIPINTTGTALALTDDGEANITSPFPFTFFGVTSSDLRVGNNGGILFGVTTGDLGLTNAALPTVAGLPAPAMLPFWDDMDDETGDVYWEVQGTAPNRQLIVEWYNRPHFNGIGSVTFEVILYEGTNEIRFQYLDVDFGDPLYNFGLSATAGINRNATVALQTSFNQAVIQNGQAILFVPETIYSASASDTATVNVVYPNINVSPLSLSSTQVAGTTATQPLAIGNTGLAPLNWQISETQPDLLNRPAVLPAPEPVFDVPAAVTSEKDCAAFENYPGREPDGWAEFCGASGAASANQPESPASTGYLINLRTPDRNLKRFTLNNFPGQTVVGAQAANIYGMDFDSTATTLYALNATTNELGTLNTTTGAFTAIVACPAPAGGTWTDLSINPTTNVFYASTASNLYTLNPATCSPTLIGPFGVASGIMIDLAVNPAGVMYGHDIFTDSIYTINTTTGAATLVGLTGFLANFAQGMDFDNEDGTLYIFLYVGTGVNQYGTVNLATGAVTALATTNPSGEFEGATQTLGVCIPNDYPWLSASPASSTTAAGSSTPVTVTFDATALACGASYTAQLCVRSNDPDPGPGNGTNLVQVPVNLTVDCPAPAITLAKTVGTVPGVCATTDVITVASGTTVYYCYEVTNTGNVTLNLHNLTDSALGTIFTGLNYALTPGSSVNTVAAGLSIPAVITATTTNTATWTAYNAGPVNQVSATDTATVNVLPPPDVSGTKTVSGTFTQGSTVTYTVVLTNTGAGPQNDNPGDEFSDVLPATLTLVSAAASSGATALAGNTVTWNGSIPAARQCDDHHHGDRQPRHPRPVGQQPGHHHLRRRRQRHQRGHPPHRRPGRHRRRRSDGLHGARQHPRDPDPLGDRSRRPRPRPRRSRARAAAPSHRVEPARCSSPAPAPAREPGPLFVWGPCRRGKGTVNSTGVFPLCPQYFHPPKGEGETDGFLPASSSGRHVVRLSAGRAPGAPRRRPGGSPHRGGGRRRGEEASPPRREGARATRPARVRARRNGLLPRDRAQRHGGHRERARGQRRGRLRHDHRRRHRLLRLHRRCRRPRVGRGDDTVLECLGRLPARHRRERRHHEPRVRRRQR